MSRSPTDQGDRNVVLMLLRNRENYAGFVCRKNIKNDSHEHEYCLRQFTPIYFNIESFLIVQLCVLYMDLTGLHLAMARSFFFNKNTSIETGMSEFCSCVLA